MKNKIIIAALGGIFLCLIVGYGLVNSGELRMDEDKYYKVAYVIDGDTFASIVDGKEIVVRMLGIDTPETVDPRKPVQCYGKEASDNSRDLLAGRSVRFGINPNRELKDRYGRYLLYVYRDDGLFVNENLLSEGFAWEYTFGKPYSMQKEFRKVENDTKKAGIGLWAKCKIQ